MRYIHNIRRYLKRRWDRILNNRYQQDILNAIPFWLGAGITGFIAVLYARLFYWAELGTSWLYHFNKWLFFLVTPGCFVLGWWLVQRYAPFSRGSGIPQVSASIELANPKKYHLVGRMLSVRVLVVKIASSLVMVFGGGVVGREGPTIQIAGSVFKKINDWLPSWYPKVSKKNMLITGAAAGLAAAFNTPLGGIVFAIEELTRTHFNYFKSALLTGVIIAGLTALNILGPYLYLGYPQVGAVPLWVVFPVILVALVAGYSGSAMGKMVLWIMYKKKAYTGPVPKIIYAVIAGLIVAAVGVLIDPKMFGSGREIMQTTLLTSDKHMEWYVPLLRTVGPMVSFTNGAAGGIFAPSLSAGASIGSVFSGWFQMSDSNSNLMILSGMVGFLTGITRSPFTSSILVLEMTTADEIIFYLMLAGLASNMMARLVDRRSFYDQLKEQYIEELTHSEAANP